MRTKNYTWIGAAAGMLVLILDARTALGAAKEGVALCVQTLIPSLFPFFVFSTLLTGALAGTPSKFLSPVEKILRIPAGSGSLLLIGLLGGYPTGAQCIRQAYDRGQLSRRDALRMLGFCNNAGPSFLFGIVAAAFPGTKYVWLLWLIHILSALTVSFLLPGMPEQPVLSTSSGGLGLTEALDRSVRIMASVCGWVVMFRLILSFLDRWIFWMFPLPVQVMLKGLTELTNGCVLLEEITDLPLRFLTASVLTGFGGCCVLLQTKSAIRDFPLLPCFRGKLLHAGISFLYSFHALFLLPEKLPGISPALLLIMDLTVGFLLILTGQSRKIVVAFRRNMVYNRCNVQK